MSRPLLFLALIAREAVADTLMLAMRDGVQLHTEFDLPPFFPAGKRTAAVLERSPYGANAEELIADVFGEALGYASVRQDIRGTKQSQGAFDVWHDAQNDAFDTIAWIVKQPWSNGVVFTTGASADAIDELAQMPGPHPALRGQVVIFATADGYGTFFPGGAYRESLIDGWLKDTVPTQYATVDALVRNEEQPGRPWWDAVNGSMYWKNIDFPTIAWAGWYDIFQQGNWDQYDGEYRPPGPPPRRARGKRHAQRPRPRPVAAAPL
jgi:predicted acyl esterase